MATTLQSRRPFFKFPQRAAAVSIDTQRILQTLQKKSGALSPSIANAVKAAVAEAEQEAQSNGQHYGAVLLPSRESMRHGTNRTTSKRQLLQWAG
jgi:hypothetical protein